MPLTEHETPENRVSSIEKQLGILDYRLGKNEEILNEIKTAIQQLVILNEKQQVLREDLTMLEKRFDERKAATQPVIDRCENIIGRIHGAALVIGLLFAILGFMATSSLARLDTVEQTVHHHNTEIAVLKNDLRAHEVADEMQHK